MNLKGYMDELRRLADKGYPDTIEAVRWYDTRPPEIKKLMRLYPPGKYQIVGRELSIYGYGDSAEGKGTVLLLVDDKGKDEKCCVACLIKSERLGSSWPLDLEYERDLTPESFELPDCVKH